MFIIRAQVFWGRAEENTWWVFSKSMKEVPQCQPRVSRSVMMYNCLFPLELEEWRSNCFTSCLAVVCLFFSFSRHTQHLQAEEHGDGPRQQALWPPLLSALGKHVGGVLEGVEKSEFWIFVRSVKSVVSCHSRTVTGHTVGKVSQPRFSVARTYCTS